MKPSLFLYCHNVFCLYALLLTVSGLAKVAIFTTNVDAENQTLINHKCGCGALNRHFCQTRVTTSASLSAVVCMSCSDNSHLSFSSAVGHY